MAHTIQPSADKHSDRVMHHRRHNHSVVSGPVMFFIVVVAILFVMSVFFRVSDIQVVGNTHYTDEEIIMAIDIEEGDNLFFFDRFSAISRVFAKLPYINEVSVERSLPNKVVIEVTESEALAYLILGDEFWTMDQNCKILGKAVGEELNNLIPIEGIDPGTLLIGEPLTTANGDTALVEYLSEFLCQIQERGIYTGVTKIDFSNVNSVEFQYGGRFTVKFGNSTNVEHKFGMFVAALTMLSSGDVGLLDISDGQTAHFMSE